MEAIFDKDIVKELHAMMGLYIENLSRDNITPKPIESSSSLSSSASSSISLEMTGKVARQPLILNREENVKVYPCGVRKLA